MITNIRHAAVVVTDLKKSLKFYKFLGFEVVNKGSLSKQKAFELLLYTRTIKWIKLSLPKTKTLLELYYIPDYIGFSGLELNHFAVTLANYANIHELFKLAEKEEFAWSKKVFENKTHKFFFIKDPDNNLIEVVQEKCK